MEFVFETRYDAKTMAVMAKALRKTVRKKRSRRSHVFGVIVSVLALLLLASTGLVFDVRTIVTIVAVLAIMITLLFEDRINGYIAKKRLLRGMETAMAVFSKECYTSTTEIGKTQWNYDKIQIVAETPDYFVFIFSASHAQLYDKQSLKGGTSEDFRRFIEQKTDKQVTLLS